MTMTTDTPERLRPVSVLAGFAARHLPPLFAQITITPAAVKSLFDQYARALPMPRESVEYIEARALIRAGAPIKHRGVCVSRDGRVLEGLGILAAIFDADTAAEVFVVVNLAAAYVANVPTLELDLDNPFEVLDRLGAQPSDPISYLEDAPSPAVRAARELLPPVAPSPISTDFGASLAPLVKERSTPCPPMTWTEVTFDTDGPFNTAMVGRPLDGPPAPLMLDVEAPTPAAEVDDGQGDEQAGADLNFGRRLQSEGIKNGVAMAAIARRIVLHQNGGDIHDASRPHSVSEAELRALIDYNPHRLHDATRRASACNRQLGLTVGPVGFASWYIDAYTSAYNIATAHKPDHVDVSKLPVEQFFTDLGTGAMLPEGDPVLILRARLLERRTGRTAADMNDATVVAHIVAAWNARRAGKSIARLALPAAGYDHTHVPGYPIPR